MALRGDAVDAEPPGEAGPLVRVEPDVLEDGRIDDAGAAHLEPAGVLAEDAARSAAEEARDVELDGGLREREEARAHADIAVATEHLVEEVQQRSLQVGERDVAVDCERLDL